MVIFGCGVVTGGLLMKTELPPAPVVDVAPHPPNSTNQSPGLGQFQRPEFLRRMEKQLDLSASQRDEVVKAMKASQERTRPLWDQIAPQLRQEMKRLREEIRQILTPDQQKKYDELLKSRPRKAAAQPTNAP
jgi:Spy/CpxP family protein refolding chaperone